MLPDLSQVSTSESYVAAVREYVYGMDLMWNMTAWQLREVEMDLATLRKARAQIADPADREVATRRTEWRLKGMEGVIPKIRAAKAAGKPRSSLISGETKIREFWLTGWVHSVIGQIDYLREKASQTHGAEAERFLREASEEEVKFRAAVAEMDAATREAVQLAADQCREMQRELKEIPRKPTDWKRVEADFGKDPEMDDFTISAIASLAFMSAEAARQKAEKATGPEAQALWREATAARAKLQGMLDEMGPRTRAYAQRSIGDFKTMREDVVSGNARRT